MAPTSTSYFWHNVTFHERAGDAAGDQTLKRTLDSLGISVLRLRHHSLSLPGRMELSLQDHRRLVRAYRERDGALAGALSRSIVGSALRAIRAEPGPIALVEPGPVAVLPRSSPPPDHNDDPVDFTSPGR